MSKLVLVVCDYCGDEREASRDTSRDLELRFSGGIKSLHLGEPQRDKEKDDAFFKRVHWLSDACEKCVQKAASALGLRLERDAQDRYYFKKVH